MYSVSLAFSADHPDPEDDAVKSHLAEYQLEPKRQWKENWDGQDYNVMSFGGCYLGRHLEAIGEMQRVAVEREMLGAEIGRILNHPEHTSAQETADRTPPTLLKELIAGLIDEFHHESSFDSDVQGYLKVTLDSVAVQQKFVELAASGSWPR